MNRNAFHYAQHGVTYNPRYIPLLIERKKNAPITEVCNELLQVADAMCHVEDEMQAFNAPSECAGLVYRGMNDRVDEIIRAHGWSKPVLRGVVRARTSDKWLHFSKLGLVL